MSMMLTLLSDDKMDLPVNDCFALDALGRVSEVRRVLANHVLVNIYKEANQNGLVTTTMLR